MRENRMRGRPNPVHASACSARTSSENMTSTPAAAAGRRGWRPSSRERRIRGRERPVRMWCTCRAAATPWGWAMVTASRRRKQGREGWSLLRNATCHSEEGDCLRRDDGAGRRRLLPGRRVDDWRQFNDHTGSFPVLSEPLPAMRSAWPLVQARCSNTARHTSKALWA